MQDVEADGLGPIAAKKVHRQNVVVVGFKVIGVGEVPFPIAALLREFKSPVTNIDRHLRAKPAPTAPIFPNTPVFGGRIGDHKKQPAEIQRALLIVIEG